MLKRYAWMLRGALAVALCVLLVGRASLAGEASSLQQAAPTLGTAASFAVLGAATVTNTGTTIVTGDLGVSPGTSVTGFPPGTMVGGTIHAADATAAQARTDATAAYNNLAGQTCTRTFTPPEIAANQELGGRTLGPGVYCFASSAQLTGPLTLDAAGNPAAVFVFKIGSTLTTASSSSVVMTNAGSACNVFWQVGSSATLGTTSAFAGNILALTSITLTTNARVTGRTMAGNGDVTGAVTMDTNTVGGCAAAATPTPIPPTATPTPIPPTLTAIAAATATAIATLPPPTQTAVIAATNTAVAAATATAIATLPPPTRTAVIAATNTAVAAATATAITALPPPTQTAVIAATNTAVAAATATAITALPPPTQTAVIAATNTVVAAATSTAIAALPVATRTAVAGLTAIAGLPVATQTAVAAATAIAIATPGSGGGGQCVGNIRGSKTDGAGSGLAGWTVELLQGSEVVRTAVTDKNGNFDFLGLAMGTYTFREVAQGGWVAQGPTSFAVTIAGCGQNATGYTFVNARAGVAGTPGAITIAPTVGATGIATRTATVTVTATPAVTPIATPSRLPVQLPKTGEGPPDGAGPVALLFGALLLLGGLGARRVRVRLSRPRL